MTATILHKYVDRGERGIANLTLPPAERVLISLVRHGLRVHKLHLNGLLPGRTWFATDAAGRDRICVALAADEAGLPRLPARFQTDAALDSMLAAINSFDAPFGRDADGLPLKGLALLTRAALAAASVEAFVRRLTRAENTVPARRMTVEA